MAASRFGESQRHGAHTINDATFDADEAEEEEYGLLVQYPENIDYYSILGVPREPPPTDSQLRSAYHHLTLSFHPDKQPAHLVQAAQAQFRRIQDAYETLIDPKKRIVYDLEGEEGVKREWGATGSMGSRRAQIQNGHSAQVGPRTMSPTEFRRWFLAKMKAREREALDSLVGARGSMSIGIDASSLVSPGEEEGYVQLNMPTVRPSRYGLGYAFKTTLPDFSGLWAWVSGNQGDVEGEPLPEDAKPELPEVTFQTSISGAVRKTNQKIQVEREDGTSEIIKVDGPSILGAATFSLNANISHQITGVGLRAGPHSKLWSFLNGVLIGGNVDILPSQGLAVYMSKQVSPFPHSKPFTVTVTSTMPSNPSQHMPVVSASVARRFGVRKFGSLTYSSGLHMWPSFVQSMYSSYTDTSPDPKELFLLASQPSSLQLKYTTMPDAMTAEEAEELDHPNPPTKKELWQWIVSASPHGGSLSLQYARTLFADKIEDPPRSEWNLDGYHPSMFSQSRRGVRIEAEVTASLDGGMAWSISGLRRVGEVSSIGLGLSVRDARGLVMALTWRRLGQTIRVPIAICPVDLVDAELSVWAVMVPWLAYVGVEFGYIRPRERRLRREAIIRKRKLLKSQIAARKKESEQQIEMMKEHIGRRQLRERSQGGLYITKAEYGYRAPESPGCVGERAESKLIDVTIPVAARVDKGQLFISKNTSRFQIIGFYDPAPLLPKILRIWYLFRDQIHYVEAKDGEEDIAIPRREHRDPGGDDIQISSLGAAVGQFSKSRITDLKQSKDEDRGQEGGKYTMCFCFPSKSYVLEPYPPKRQWRYVRQRVGTRIVARHIEHGTNVLGKTFENRRSTTATLPLTVSCRDSNTNNHSTEACRNDTATSTDGGYSENKKQGGEGGNKAEAEEANTAQTNNNANQKPTDTSNKSKKKSKNAAKESNDNGNNNDSSQSRNSGKGDENSRNDASSSNQDLKSENASEEGDNNKNDKSGNTSNDQPKKEESTKSNNQKGKKGKGEGGNNKNNNNKKNQKGSTAQESSTKPDAEQSESSNAPPDQSENSKDNDKPQISATNDENNKKKVTFTDAPTEWAVSTPDEWGASVTATESDKKEGDSSIQTQDTSTNNDAPFTDFFNSGDSEQPSTENTGEKPGGGETSWFSPDADSSWRNNNETENVGDAGNASSSEWANGTRESNNSSAEATSEWDNGAATTTTTDTWNGQTTENSNVDSWQDEQTEVGAAAPQKEKQLDDSREPRVNNDKVMEFWVHESNGSWSLKTGKEIRDNCQPGEWKQDDAGFPYFERKTENPTSTWDGQHSDDAPKAMVLDVQW
ncbi:hypothetical protein UA08_00446 [Talaromyces atroroseus]|uniref:J domain-containing protein n=1 Tax=Talaromyces atroroseus TaxID=1441469 RepID=A0A225B166_TALAT|nr:hypothetical protein UA08_00446 [Talaromyces atroroseus]OKL64454.1 hypothetical protein UA08_00446 [Talaromyces atroroseus]